MWLLFAVDYNSQGYYWGTILGYCTLAGIVTIVGYKALRFVIATTHTPKLASSGIDPSEVIDDRPKKQDVVYKSEKVPEWKILPRDKATRRLLKYMSAQDKWFERKYLCEILEDVYVRLREATERRSVKSVETDLTQEHADELHAQLKAMKKKRQRRIFGKVKVIDINILQIEATGPKDKHTVTALVTAQSKDYVEDDETGKAVEGKKKTYYFQEFWTLRRGAKRWLVELIRPPGDADSVLEAKNVLSKADYDGLKAEAESGVLEHVVARD